MNPYLKGNNAYKKAAVTTKDQGSLIIMLYDGAIRFLKVAEKKIIDNDIEGSHTNITKAKNIISELMGSLKVERGGKIAKDLKALYGYMYNRLIDAKIHKKHGYVAEVIELMTELRQGWKALSTQKKTTAANSFNSRSVVKPLNIRG